MKKSIFLIMIAGTVLFFTSCSENTQPVTPYLVLYPSSAVFIATDSVNYQAAGDSAIVVKMSDGSAFTLSPGTSVGYSRAFSWRVEDTSAATVHRVILSAQPRAIAQPTRGEIYEADYYPIISNSSKFLSTLPIVGELIHK